MSSNNSTISIFGSCLWGMTQQRGMLIGWLLPTCDAENIMWQTDDPQPYIVTRPCVSEGQCMEELALRANMSDIDLSDGTRV